MDEIRTHIVVRCCLLGFRHCLQIGQLPIVAFNIVNNIAYPQKIKLSFWFQQFPNVLNGEVLAECKAMIIMIKLFLYDLTKLRMVNFVRRLYTNNLRVNNLII